MEVCGGFFCDGELWEVEVFEEFLCLSFGGDDGCFGM